MNAPKKKATPRPHVSIHFKCCNVYSKIFLNHNQTAFAGHCPKCAKAIRIAVGKGGSDSRFWEVG